MNEANMGPAASPARRRWLLAAAAGTAAVAGAGVAWWRTRAAQEQQAADAAGVQQFWTQEFETPQGGRLAMAKLRGRPLLVNFWATWCAPCIEEMPMLDAFYRQHARNGFEIVGLAIDQPSSVRKFLERAPVAFPIGLAGFGGTELTKVLGNNAGGLPFSVLFDAEGHVRQRRIGRLTDADLSAWRGAA
jgi:thiol-disulfide isomerase/thioredoxin